MNNTILSKILEELNKETPRIDYVKGMLETLIELQEIPKIKYLPLVREEAIAASEALIEAKNHAVLTAPDQDIETMKVNLLEAQARAALKTTQELAAKSMQS